MSLFVKHRKRVYLDYASATPSDAQMWRSYVPLPEPLLWVNPGALHKEGVAATRALGSARAEIAQILHAHVDEIIFTSGATESNTLALLGAAGVLAINGDWSAVHVITTALEHPSVIDAVELLEEKGTAISLLSVNENGLINPKELHELLDERPTIISCAYANGEIGTIQPIRQIAKEIRDWKKTHPMQTVLFHIDATQAAPFLSLNVLELHADLLTIGSTKLYCPRGVGILFKKRTVRLQKLHRGGNQEFGLRPGTVPLDLVHRFSHALSYAAAIQEKETERLVKLQTYFEQLLQERIPRLRITAAGVSRLPFITHVALAGIDSELLALELDARGIAVSSKSACKNDESGSSSLVDRLYGDSVGVVRFSYGRHTTKKELGQAVHALFEVLQKYGKI